MSNPTQAGDDPHRALWFALALIVSVIVGGTAGVLSWLSGTVVAGAIILGGAAFAGALGLTMGVVTFFRKQ